MPIVALDDVLPVLSSPLTVRGRTGGLRGGPSSSLSRPLQYGATHMPHPAFFGSFPRGLPTGIAALISPRDWAALHPALGAAPAVPSACMHAGCMHGPLSACAATHASRPVGWSPGQLTPRDGGTGNGQPRPSKQQPRKQAKRSQAREAAKQKRAEPSQLSLHECLSVFK